MTKKADKIKIIIDTVFKNENELDFYHKEEFSKNEHNKKVVALNARISREEAKIILENMHNEDIDMYHQKAKKRDIELVSCVILASHNYHIYLPENKDDEKLAQHKIDNDLSDTESVNYIPLSEEELYRDYLQFFKEEDLSATDKNEKPVVFMEEDNVWPSDEEAEDLRQKINSLTASTPVTELAVLPKRPSYKNLNKFSKKDLEHKKQSFNI